MKDGDPSNDHLATYNWCQPPVNRCETQMTGLTYVNGADDAEGMRASRPAPWMWMAPHQDRPITAIAGLG